MVSPEIAPMHSLTGILRLEANFASRGIRAISGVGGGTGSESRGGAPAFPGDGLKRLVQDTQVFITGARRDQEQHELKRRHLGIDAGLLQPLLDVETREAQCRDVQRETRWIELAKSLAPGFSAPKQSIPGNPRTAERNASARSIVRVHSTSPSSAS